MLSSTPFVRRVAGRTWMCSLEEISNNATKDTADSSLPKRPAMQQADQSGPEAGSRMSHSCRVRIANE